MKTAATVVLMSLCIGCAPAQTRDWKATVTVIDEAGQPVAGAKVEMSWNVNAPDLSTTFDKVERLTDTNGVCNPSHEANGSIGLGFSASKTGYYSATKGYELAQLSDSDPAKWNPVITLLLKKIRNPIPMYAKRVNLGMPLFDKAAGFDLMAGYWVAPYGEGVSTDILFTAHLDKRAEYDSDYRLIVGFPNPGDGIQEFQDPSTRFPGDGSTLRSSQEAPADGYQPQWIQTKSVRPGQGYSGNRDENRNYYFRVRTVLDEKGNVKSALYGKIYGDFMQFRYYLNPTPNDRNVEFDPKRNLLGGLKSFEQVDAP